ncbi:MAG: hypothetical protein WCL39_03165, partial [Armatimonadota bacterium]
MLCCLFAFVFVSPVGALTDFMVSFWCGPNPTLDADKRYKEISDANFNVCFPPCEATTVDQQWAALEACRAHGLKYVVQDGRILSKAPTDPDFGGNLDVVVQQWAKHPALAGYFIADEPGASAFPTLAAVNKYLLEKDPKRLPYINLLPNYATADQLGCATYEDYVDKFCSVVKPKLLSFDHYALFDKSERAEYFDNLEIIRRQGLKHKIPTCDILLLLPHGPYRDPSDADMEWQVNTALAYGNKAIMYFTYWTPPADPTWQWTKGAVTRSGKRTEHYNQVKEINRRLKLFGPTLMKLTSTDVYHTGDLPVGTKAQPSDSPVQTPSPGL